MIITAKQIRQSFTVKVDECNLRLKAWTDRSHAVAAVECLEMVRWRPGI